MSSSYVRYPVASGTGTVTSVGLSAPSILSVANSPVTGSGTLALTLATQAANLVFAGPTTGSAVAPTFRSLVTADIPSLSSVYLPLSGGTLTGGLIGTTASFSSTIGGSNFSGSSSGSNTGDQTITLTGEATGSGTGSFAVTLTNASVTGKVLTGYTSGAGTVASTDSLLQAIQKLNGNDGLRALSATTISTTSPLSGGGDLSTNRTLSLTTVPANLGGTGVANNVASTLTISGSFGTTLTVSGTTALTLPTSGTLATLAGTEALTNKTIQLTTTGGTAATLNYYEEFSTALTFAGSNISQSSTVKIYQIGKVVTIEIGQFSGTANNTAATISSGAIPSRFFPAQTEFRSALVRNNGTSSAGFIAVNTNGTIDVNNLPSANFNGSVIMFQQTITYLL